MNFDNLLVAVVVPFEIVLTFSTMTIFIIGQLS